MLRRLKKITGSKRLSTSQVSDSRSTDSIIPSPPTPLAHQSQCQPFNVAYDKCLQDLPEDRRTIFVQAFGRIDEESLLSDLRKFDDNHRTSSILRPLTPKIKTFLDILNCVTSGVQICIQSSPEISSLVVGGVRTILEFALRSITYLSRLTDMIYELGPYLSPLKEHAKSKDPRIIEEVGACYGELLRFCSDAHDILFRQKAESEQPRRSSSLWIFLQAQWKPFEDRFGETRLRFERHYKVIKELTAATMANTTATMANMIANETLNAEIARIRVQKKEKEQESEEFLEWLSNVDVEEHHFRVSDERFKDSGGWIFNTQKLKSWLENGASDILWIYGMPGAGKSVIASNIIDYLVRSYFVPEIGIAFVYHDYNDVDKFGSLRRLITAMMAQLCRRLATLPSDLTMLKSKHSSPTAAGTDEFFLRLAGEFKEVYLIIDALDEWSLELRQDLLEFLLRLKKEKSPIFKVLITSRPETDIHATLGQCITLNLRTQRDHICDIKDVIQGKVDEFVQSGRLYLKRAELRNEIVSILTEKSQGIFLWSILVLKALCEESLAYQNDDCTLQCLREFPAGLGPFYDRVIKKIEVQKSRYRNLARSTLQWICYAKSPVTATELMHALEFDGAIDRHTINIKAIEAACKNLVIEHQGYLRFIHFTVQQYLEDQGVITDATLSMSTTCLHYLEGVSHAFPQIHETHLSHIDNKFPFARHAADYWGNYTQEALQHDASGLLKAKARTLLSAVDFSAASSRLMSRPDDYYVHGRGLRENLSSLHLIAYFGLHNLLQENEYQISALELEAKDYEGRTPLSWAAAHGHLECARILWSGHPDHGNFQDGNGLTALSWAAINGHENIILWLTQQEGIDIARQDSNGRTAMSHAAEFGHTSIIRILHELNPKLVNIYDTEGLSPLFWAGTNGHLDTVKLFIDELGCHPESTDRKYSRRTLLAHVAESGHTEVVTYLLKEKEVEAFRYDHDRETALSIAVKWGNRRVVEAIYHHGLENYSEQVCARVCGHALRCGIPPIFHQDQEEIIVILLRKADVNYVDPDGTSALMIAALNGYENIVRLLIKRSDINLRDRHMKTAWDYAKENGQINIVRTLEAAGCDTVDFTEIYARFFPK